MKLIRILIIFLALFSCNSNKQESIDKSEGDKTTIENKIESVSENEINPIDTILENLHDTLNLISPIKKDSLEYVFWKITKKEYNVLHGYRNYIQIPKDDYSNILTINKENIIINFGKGNIDTLWNKLDKNGVDYHFENYSSSEKYVILSYFDGEASFDFLVDLNSRKYTGLYSILKLSPNNKILVSYNHIEANPLQGSGIMIMRFEKGEKLIDMEIKEPKYLVKEFNWLNDKSGILKLELFDWKEYQAIEEIYSLMTIKE